MKCMFLFLIIFCVGAAYAGPPTDAQLDRFFMLNGEAAAYDSTMSSVYSPMVKMMQMNIVKIKEKDKRKAEKVSAKVKQVFTWQNIKPQIYSFYKKNYSADEIDRYIKTMERPEYLVMRTKRISIAPAYDRMLEKLTIQNLLQIVIEVELESKLK